jgi:indolepyruvate ferredoxin oxidoreductase alpha subunit
VTTGERVEAPTREYHTDIQRFLVPPFARRRRPTVEARLEQLREFSEDFAYNRVEEGDPKVGVIASGVAYQYAREVLPDATYLRIGMVFPFPIETARRFCERFERVLIVEEGEPFIEEQLRIAGITNITGKDAVPLMGELNPEIVAASLLGDAVPEGFEKEIALPPRAPLFCLGCPHRGVFYVLQKMMKRNVVALGDIGCYTLGGLPPYSSMQTSFCMGASVGNALGFALGNGEEGAKAVGVIGDGTFLHGGIPGLIDMVHRGINATLVICDNSTTAMTGQQPNAATSDGGPAVDLESLLASLGVEHVQVVDPYEIKTLRKILRDAIRHPGPAVVVARHACLMLDAEKRKTREPILFEADACNKCALCADVGCPAIEWSDDTGPVIDGTRCVGCGICAELCKPGALVTVPDNYRSL